MVIELRVLLAGWETPYLFEYGGLSTFNKNLIEAILRRGYEVYYVGCINNPAKLGVHEIPTEHGSFVAFTPCLVWDLKDENLLYINHSITSLVMNLYMEVDFAMVNDYHIALPFMMKIPYKITYYAHIPAVTPLAIASMLYAGNIITNSQQTKHVLTTFLENMMNPVSPKQRIPPVDVVYPAPPKIMKKIDHEIVKELRSKGEYIIAYHGRNQPNKRPDLVIKAVNELRKHGIKAYAIITGRGFTPKKGKYYTIYGEVSNPTTYLYASDIIVIPSDFESFGLVAYEASLLKKPVVMSDRVGAKEVLKSAPVFKAGNLDSLVNILLKLYNEPQERKKIGEKLYREAKSRTWDNVLDEIIQIINTRLG